MFVKPGIILKMRHSQDPCVVLLGAKTNCPGRDRILEMRELQGWEESCRDGWGLGGGTPQLL